MQYSNYIDSMYREKTYLAFRGLDVAYRSRKYMVVHRVLN